MLKKWIGLVITTLTMVVACHSPVYNQTESNVADAKIKSMKMFKKSDNDAKTKPTLVVKNGMYVDTSPISLDREPSWLKNHIVIRGDALPFSYYSRTIALGAGSGVLPNYQTGLDQTANVSMNYSGTIKGALDLLAAKTGYIYVVHNKSILWQAYVTKTFDIAFMPGSSDYLMGKASGGSSSSNNNNSGGTTLDYVNTDTSADEFSNLKGTLSIWADINTALTQLLSPEGKLTVSESTTSVTVHDKPSNVALVGQYIKNLNHTLSKQVLVKVQVLEVNLENDYSYGIDWNLVVKAFNNSPFVINGNYGTPVSISSFSPQSSNTLSGNTANPVPVIGTNNQASDGSMPAYGILVNALNQQGKTSVVSEPRVVCLNNQVSVIRIVNSEGYVASIQNTSLSGSGTTGSTTIGQVTSQVTPGTVTTGLTLYILPKIMDGRIYLQVNADLSTNNGFTLVGPTNSQIQTPSITEKHFNQRSMIKSGDTLILSGFKQVSNKANATQLFTSQALGGKASQELSKETIVLITPFILDGSA